MCGGKIAENVITMVAFGNNSQITEFTVHWPKQRLVVFHNPSHVDCLHLINLKPFDTIHELVVLIPQNEGKLAKMAIMLYGFHCGNDVLEMAIHNFLSDIANVFHWR